MKDYSLTRDLGLKPICLQNWADQPSSWFVNADQLERLLEKGVRVELEHGYIAELVGMNDSRKKFTTGFAPYLALPLPTPKEEPDSFEKLARDFVDQVDCDFGMSSEWEELVERAKKLVGEKGE